MASKKKPDKNGSEAKKSSSKKQSKHGKKSGSLRFLIMFLLIALVVVPFGLPMLALAFGMLPTLVAIITERDRQRSSSVAIGFMNFAGVLPFWLELWQNGNTMQAAISILRRPESWLVMFGAAAIGQFILFIVPPIVSSYARKLSESKLRKMIAGRDKLREIWGEDVMTESPIAAVREAAHNG